MIGWLPAILRLSICLSLFLLFCVPLVSVAQVADKDSIISRIVSLAPPGQSLIRLYDSEDNIRFSHGQLERFIPASTLKIVVALLALNQLGRDYRFTTSVYMDADNRLLVVGKGDPFLISEELEMMARSLVNEGVTEVHSIAIDDSSIEWSFAPGTANSYNPYDVANGGLVVNFNTVYLEILTDGIVTSAEPQTPITPIAQKIGALRPAGVNRINIGYDRQHALTYAHQLIIRIFNKSGIAVHNEDFFDVRQHDNWRLIIEYSSSKKLEELVTLMFKYSNNFIANQIGLGLSLSAGITTPVSLDTAVNKAMITLRNSYGIEPYDLNIDEFSGISRNNFVTADAMYLILLAFKEYSYLLNSSSTALVKSGTLDGIYHYAGYLKVHKQLWPMLIITYSEHNNRDHILELMQSLAQIITNE